MSSSLLDVELPKLKLNPSSVPGWIYANRKNLHRVDVAHEYIAKQKIHIRACTRKLGTECRSANSVLSVAVSKSCQPRQFERVNGQIIVAEGLVSRYSRLEALESRTQMRKTNLPGLNTAQSRNFAHWFVYEPIR